MKDKPEQEDAGEKADGRMRPTKPDEPGAAAGEILRQGRAKAGGGIERVAESSERAGDSDDEDGAEAGEDEAGGAEFDAAAHEALFAREKVRGQGKRAEQEQGVRQMQSEIDGT